MDMLVVSRGWCGTTSTNATLIMMTIISIMSVMVLMVVLMKAGEERDHHSWCYASRRIDGQRCMERKVGCFNRCILLLLRLSQTPMGRVVLFVGCSFRVKREPGMTPTCARTIPVLIISSSLWTSTLSSSSSIALDVRCAFGGVPVPIISQEANNLN